MIWSRFVRRALPTVLCVVLTVRTAEAVGPHITTASSDEPPTATVATRQAGPHFVSAVLPRPVDIEIPYVPTSAHQVRPSVWQVTRVQGDGEPETVWSTGRFITGFTWSPDGGSIAARFETFGAPDPQDDTWRSLSREQLALRLYFWGGLTTLDVRAQPPAVRQDLLLAGFPGSAPSPDFSHVVIQQTVLTDDGSSGRMVIYVVARDGTAVRLDGLGDVLFALGWIPDGSGLLVQAVTADSPDRSFMYLVPLDNGPTMQVEIGLGLGRLPRTAWSPDGRRLAYQVNADLFVLDRDTGTSRPVGTNPRWNDRLQWTPDGREIIVGGDRIAVANGEVLASLGGAKAPLDVEISPDGRYLAVAEDPTDDGLEQCDTVPRQTRDPLKLDSRVYVYDRQTGERTLVQGCGAGLAGRVRWLADGKHLLLWRSNSSYPENAVTLLAIGTGRHTALTPDLEIHANAFGSPDGSRILVTGKRLRIFDADGALLREIIPPDGFDVPAAEWSPDGSSFAYLLGPAGFIPVYP